MTATIKIRVAGAGDRDFVRNTLSRMMWSLLSPERKPYTNECETAEMVASHVDFVLAAGGVALIAEREDGKPVGVLLMGERRHLFTGVNEGFVHYLYVAPGSRRAGVGRRLLCEAELLCRRKNYVFVNFETMAQNRPMRVLAMSLQYQEEYVAYRKFLAEEDRGPRGARLQDRAGG